MPRKKSTQMQAKSAEQKSEVKQEEQESSVEQAED